MSGFTTIRESYIQAVIEIHGIILTTSYWLYVELGKNYLKNSMSKNKLTFTFYKI
jgi:hypothetical protein